MAMGGWTGSDETPLSDRVAASLAATSYLGRTGRRGRSEISLFVAFLANQRAGESMHSPKYCLPGGGGRCSNAGRTGIAAGGGTVEINNYMLCREGQRARLLY